MVKNKEKTNKKAFFFLRHNNDIDHIVPVLYKWLSTENIPTEVIITSKKSFLEDYRIKLLKKYKQVKIYHINDLVKKYTLTYYFYHYYEKYGTQIDKLVKKSNFLRKFADKRIEYIAKKLFKNIDDAIVVFDWTTTYFVEKILIESKKKKFITISLPHGDAPYATIMESKYDLNFDCLDVYKTSSIFDYVVVPNKLCYRRYDGRLDKNKIIMLGSPRYSDEWLDIISEYIKPYRIKNSEKKLKIVFFLRNISYPIYWDEVVRTIKLILQFPEVYLIVKHHPRNANAKKLTKKLIKLYPEIKQSIDVNLKFIYGSASSDSLLKWSDIVIDVGTSVTWEPVKKGKPVLMLEYLHSNYSTVASYIKASEIKYRDELYDTINKFIKRKNMKFYNDSERRKFIKEIIDVPNSKILERYVKFLKSCFKN